MYQNYIKKYRLLIGLSQKDLADLVGVSRIAISSYECGKYLPALDVALRLSFFLCVPVDRLFIVYTEGGLLCQNK